MKLQLHNSNELRKEAQCDNYMFPYSKETWTELQHNQSPPTTTLTHKTTNYKTMDNIHHTAQPFHTVLDFHTR